MIIDNNTTIKLLIGIVICLILLGVCITFDSADETITSTDNNSIDHLAKGKEIIIINDSYVLDKDSGWAKSDGKLHTDKSVKTKTTKQPTVTMTGRPSCTRCARNHCAYTWRTKTYVNYCPNCHHYNTLGNKHKWQSRHEQEITCFRCDSDFCVNCGKEKYSWSSKHLRKP